MLKLYGTPACPYCKDCKENFDRVGIEYEYIDIMGELRNLGEFLALRDKNPVFDHSKEIEDIGVPALMKEDGTVFLDWEGYMKDLGYEPEYHYINEVPSCSLDGKGC